MKNFSFHLRKTVSVIAERRKMIVQFLLASLFIGLGIWFFHHEKAEILKVEYELANATGLIVLAGIFITVIYILTHSFMYRAAFAAVDEKISIKEGLILFLKRNFISVFLPAGGVSSLAFFTDGLEKNGISKTKIYFASTLYGFIGIVSAIFIAVPVFVYGLTTKNVNGDEWIALVSVLSLVAALYFLFRNITNKGYIYRLIKRFYPTIEVYINDIDSGAMNRKRLLVSLLYSLLIEVWGIFHLYLAALALGIDLSLLACATGYIIAVVFMILSPFMRGLGAVELSLGYTLTRFGISTAEAISITALYRFFEFWLPLVAGVLAFTTKVNRVLMRIIPVVLLFLLGIINLISVLTPAIFSRFVLLSNYLPMEAINASNYFVLASGLFLLLTAAFMLKGLRTAWWFAIILSLFSLVANLTKAFDYEEAIVALFVVVSLRDISQRFA